MLRPKKLTRTNRKAQEIVSKAISRLQEKGINAIQQRLLVKSQPALVDMLSKNFEKAKDLGDEDIIESLMMYLKYIEQRSHMGSTRHISFRRGFGPRKHSLLALSRPCCSDFPGFPFCDSSC